MPSYTGIPQLKFDNRDDVIKALKARRPWAKAYDAKRLAAHKAAEKDSLAKFRARCKELLAMSYQEVSQVSRRGYGDDLIKFERPDCPSALTPRLDEILRTLELSQQKTFTFDPGHTVHHILTFDENATTEMC